MVVVDDDEAAAAAAAEEAVLLSLLEGERHPCPCWRVRDGGMPFRCCVRVCVSGGLVLEQDKPEGGGDIHDMTGHTTRQIPPSIHPSIHTTQRQQGAGREWEDTAQGRKENGKTQQGAGGEWEGAVGAPGPCRRSAPSCSRAPAPGLRRRGSLVLVVVASVVL